MTEKETKQPEAADNENQQPTDVAHVPAKPAETGKKKGPAKRSHVVVEGRAVTALGRGIVKSDDEVGVGEGDFAGGEKDIKRLVKKGVLAKR